MIQLKYKDLNKQWIYNLDNTPYIKGGIKRIVNIYRSKNTCELCGKRHTKQDPLTFHHTDPFKKKYNISDLKHHKIALPVNEFLQEINSCELLCRKCHDQADIHNINDL